MTDRLQQIRARLDAATTTMPGANERMVWESDRSYRVEDDRDRASRALYHHAPADIAWLLAEVERLRRDEPVAQDVTNLQRGTS